MTGCGRWERLGFGVAVDVGRAGEPVLRDRIQPLEHSVSNDRTCRLVTLGCKVNQYETQLVKEALLAHGFREAGDGESARPVRRQYVHRYRAPATPSPGRSSGGSRRTTPAPAPS